MMWSAARKLILLPASPCEPPHPPLKSICLTRKEWPEACESQSKLEVKIMWTCQPQLRPGRGECKYYLMREERRDLRAKVTFTRQVWTSWWRWATLAVERGREESLASTFMESTIEGRDRVLERKNVQRQFTALKEPEKFNILFREKFISPLSEMWKKVVFLLLRFYPIPRRKSKGLGRQRTKAGRRACIRLGKESGNLLLSFWISGQAASCLLSLCFVRLGPSPPYRG